MSMTDQATTRARDLDRALSDIKGSRPAALRVLQMADDPSTDARRLSDAVELDPMLTAQLLKLANSAAFGMSQRISTTQHAVSLVGFDAVRSIAALLASGLRNSKTPTPDGFWEHSAATAAACAVVSSRYGVSRGEAFSIGLLHDIGAALLHSVDPVAHESISGGQEDTASQCGLEMLEFGMSHAEAAARVLRDWSFPLTFVEAVECHHDVTTASTPHVQVVLAGDALAHLVLQPSGLIHADPTHLESLGISEDALPALVELTAEYSAEVLASLPG